MDENLQPLEGMNQELEEVEDTEQEQSIEDLRAELERERQAKAEILARAKKAEAINKQRSSTTNNVSEVDIEAKILKSQGIDDDMIEEMKTLATLRGKTLLEMKSDPIIVAMNQEKERQEKERQARLGASRSSGAVKQEVTTQTPGLSGDEHKRLWKELNNK